MKKTRKPNKQFYELILFKQGEMIERVKTDKFATYKGEYERLASVAAASPLYELIVNLYDQNNEFEKRIN